MIFLSFVGSLRANTTDHYLWSPSSLRLLNPSRNSTRIPNIPPQYLAGRLFSLTEIISSKSWGEMMMITMIMMTKSWWERIKNKERSVVVHVFSDIVFASQCLCHSTTSLEGDDEDENANEEKNRNYFFTTKNDLVCSNDEDVDEAILSWLVLTMRRCLQMWPRGGPLIPSTIFLRCRSVLDLVDTITTPLFRGQWHYHQLHQPLQLHRHRHPKVMDIQCIGKTNCLLDCFQLQSAPHTHTDLRYHHQCHDESGFPLA